MTGQTDLTAITVEIVSAYVRGNAVEARDLPALIEAVYATLRGLSTRGEDGPVADQTPAVAIRKSISPDHVICLECGKKSKSLRRHLRTRHGMTPEQYRAKWGLPHDYPMVAPNYAKARSKLARDMGLGKPRRDDDDDDGGGAPAEGLD